MRPISSPGVSSGFIAILNRALISLAQPGCWGREWRLVGLQAKGVFLQILWTPSSLLRKKWIILSPAPSWSPELNSLLCFGKKAGRRPLQFESQWAYAFSLCFGLPSWAGVWTPSWKPQPRKCVSVLMFYHQNFPWMLCSRQRPPWKWELWATFVTLQAPRDTSLASRVTSHSDAFLHRSDR